MNITKTVETSRGSKTPVSLPISCWPHITSELLRLNIFVIVECSLMFPLPEFATFSNAVSTAQAHTIERGGFPQRVTQNSA